MGSLLDQQYEIYGRGGGPPLLLDSDFERQHPRKRRKISNGSNNAVGQILAVTSQNKGKTPSPSKLPGGFPPEFSFRALAVYSFVRTLSVRLRLSPFTPNVFLRALYLPYPNNLIGEVHVSLLRVLLMELNLGYSFKQKGAIAQYNKRRLIDNLRIPLKAGDNLTYMDSLSWPLFFDDYSHLTADRLWKSLMDQESYADIRQTDSEFIEYPPDYQDEQFVAEKQTKILHTKPRMFPSSDYPPPTATEAELESWTPKSAIEGESGQKGDTSPKSRVRRLPIHKKSTPSLNHPSGQRTTNTAQKNSLVYGVEHAVYPGILLPADSPEKHPGLQLLRGNATETPNVPDRPLNVSDNVADALRNFVSKIPSERIIPVDEDDSDTSVNFDKDEELPSIDRHFTHFDAMKTMRSGIPYHRLPLNQKLDILEFLVDELLELPSVAAEFSMRHGSLCVYPYPYAGWPQKSELESLNNEDECGICRLEGDLLCCDGCSRSYHKACIGMRPAEELPEGEWLCPECQVVDPSKFGPLHGGQKESVDWVKISDVARRIQAEHLNCQSYAQSFPFNSGTTPSATTYPNPNSSQHSALIFNPISSLVFGPSGPTSNIAASLVTPNNALAVGPSAPASSITGSLVTPTNAVAAVPNGSASSITDSLANPNSASGACPSSQTSSTTGSLVTSNNSSAAITSGQTSSTTGSLVTSNNPSAVITSGQTSSVTGSIINPNSALAAAPSGITGTLVVPSGPSSSTTGSFVNPNNSFAVVPTDSISSIKAPVGAPKQFSESTGQNHLLHTNGINFGNQNQQQVSNAIIGVPNQLAALSSAVSMPNTQMIPDSTLDGVSFLIIHGFVFRRNDSDVSGTAPYTVLLEAEVNEFTSRFRLSIAPEWPFRQIPTPWESGGIHFPSLQNYFRSIESFNPSKFVNKYKGALVPHSFKVDGGLQDASLVSKTFENECHSTNSRFLNEALQRDMSLDSHIATCLRTQTDLFNPYEFVAGYMLKLDVSLRKACLTDCSWDSGNIRAVHEVWAENVKRSKSVYRLAKLLVQLVDHIHPRAFLEGWFHNKLLKKQESEHVSERNYETLPPDWDASVECRKRRWELTPSNMLMTLCAREKVELSSFVTGINPSSIQITTGILRNPRKKARTSVDKHAAKMMVQVPIVTNEVSTSGSDMNVDSFETPPVYIDTSDIIPPQKPYPAYFQFANRRRLEMKEKHPGISSVEISKMLSDIWKNETDEFREKYSIEETKQRAEYKIAMEEYHKKIRERVATAQASAAQETSKDADDDENAETKGVVADTPSSRRSRRSGRIASHEPSVGTSASISSGQASLSTLNSKLSIQDSKRKHMIAVEKLLKSPTQKEILWPLAGRIPFATVGDLPPKDMRRLARNGGVAFAPHVAYNSAHEVGQVCRAHIWRKKTGTCRTFEDLIYQARRLESFIDRQTMHSFEGTVRRGKSQFLKEVRCSQVDPESGLLYHFVVNKKSGRGCWMSEDTMDVASSTLEQLKRKTKQLDLRRERERVALLARKAEEEKKERERIALMMRKAEEQRKERERVALLAKKAEEAKRLSSGMTNLYNPPMQRGLQGGSLHLAPRQQHVPSMVSSREPSAANQTRPNNLVQNHNVGLSNLQGNRPQPQQDLSGIQTQLKLALKRHEMDARQLFQTFSVIGRSPTAENALALRQKNFEAIKAAAKQLQKFQPNFLCEDVHIIGMMKHAEKTAVGVSLDSLSNGNQAQNRHANSQSQQRGAVAVNGAANAFRPIIRRDGSSDTQTFQMPRSNIMNGLDPSPIANGQLNGYGANGSSLVGNLFGSSNSPQNLAARGQVQNATRQGSNMGMFAGQIPPNMNMNLGSNRTLASDAQNNTGFNQGGLAQRVQNISTTQSNRNRSGVSLTGMTNSMGTSVGQARLNQAAGQSQGWSGMGNFQQTQQARAPISSTSASPAFFQQGHQRNVGASSQSQLQQQLSQSHLQQQLSQNQLQQQLSQSQLQQQLSQSQLQQQLSQSQLQQQLSQQILLQAQNFQKQNLSTQQQLTQNTRDQLNLALASQRAHFNQNTGAVPTPNAQQGANALNQQQLQQQLPAWLQGNFFPPNGMQ